jgi:hypothetical protein
METKHTPGPWVGWEEGDAIYIAGNPSGVIGGMRKLAYMVDTWAGHQTTPNARLIAAAPDLLFAAQLAEGVLSRQNECEVSTVSAADALLRLRRAIASATGAPK